MRDVTKCRDKIPGKWDISTHTSHAGRDGNAVKVYTVNITFLLTRPMRDVTMTENYTQRYLLISTHTSHAGRDGLKGNPFSERQISTHTSHAGRDDYHPAPP